MSLVNQNLALTEQIHQSEALFRNFFNLPLVGAAITSREKGWIEVNDRTCEILGYSREELFKKDWAELTHPDDLAADIAQFERMLAGEIDSYSLEKRFIRSDGAIVWTILSGGRSCLAGEASEYFYVQILDISERKHAELSLLAAKIEAEEAQRLLHKANEELQRYSQKEIERSRMEEREQLLQDMHDGFGSQLASIRIMAEQGKINSEDLPKYLEEISQDLHLIVDTLGHPLGLTLKDALFDMRYRLQHRFISGSPFIHWKIQLDEMHEMEPRKILHILRIMQEAINNAIRHGKPDNVWLESEFVQSENILKISVSDDGIGMPELIRKGRGLNNIEQRARHIGANVDWIDHGPGTELMVIMPFR